MVKQVLVMRSDLKCRKGKLVAQGAHASIAWLTNRLKDDGNYKYRDGKRETTLSGKFTQEEIEWMTGPFTKVTVRVDSEEELLELKRKADERGVLNVLITDAGKTEFGGVPTNTYLAVGPADADEVDIITGELELY